MATEATNLLAGPPDLDLYDADLGVRPGVDRAEPGARQD